MVLFTLRSLVLLAKKTKIQAVPLKVNRLSNFDWVFSQSFHVKLNKLNIDYT